MHWTISWCSQSPYCVCMMRWTVILMLLAAFPECSHSSVSRLDIHAGPQYKPTALGHSINYGAIQKESFWVVYDPIGIRVRALVQGLAPSLLRIGGSETEFVTFCRNCTPVAHTALSKGPTRKDFTPYNLTTLDVDMILYMTEDLNSSLILDINVNKRDSRDDFDPSNFVDILNYLSPRTSHIPVGFQLGNEPNAYKRILHRYITPQQLVRDHRILRRALAKSKFYGPIFGPEVTKPSNSDQLTVDPDVYLSSFLQAGGADSVDCISWHQYYVNSKTAALKDFINPDVFDLLKQQIKDRQKVLAANNATKPMCLTETGSTWGGGTEKMSNRFISGFMLMDKLGVSSLNNISLVIRQSLFHGHYALINSSLYPNPDYWICVLYTRLIKPQYTAHEVTCPSCNKYQRFYAFLSPSGGLVVIMGMNLDPINDFQFAVPKFTRYQSYVLTALHGNLQADRVLLNGRKLRVGPFGQLPDLQPEVTKSINLPSQTYGFFVLT